MLTVDISIYALDVRNTKWRKDLQFKILEMEMNYVIYRLVEMAGMTTSIIISIQRKKNINQLDSTQKITTGILLNPKVMERKRGYYCDKKEEQKFILEGKMIVQKLNAMLDSIDAFVNKLASSPNSDIAIVPFAGEVYYADTSLQNISSYDLSDFKES